MDEEKQERGEQKKGWMNKHKGKSMVIHSPHRS